MAEIRQDNQFGFLNVTLDAPVAGTSEVIANLFAVAPDFATLSPGDYVKLVLDGVPGPFGLPNPNFEIVYLTAYTAGSKNGTITRGAEDPTTWPPVAHTAGTSTWANNPTVEDFSGMIGPSGISGVNGACGVSGVAGTAGACG